MNNTDETFYEFFNYFLFPILFFVLVIAGGMTILTAGGMIFAGLVSAGSAFIIAVVIYPFFFKGYIDEQKEWREKFSQLNQEVDQISNALQAEQDNAPPKNLSGVLGELKQLYILIGKIKGIGHASRLPSIIILLFSSILYMAAMVSPVFFPAYIFFSLLGASIIIAISSYLVLQIAFKNKARRDRDVEKLQNLIDSLKGKLEDPNKTLAQKMREAIEKNENEKLANLLGEVIDTDSKMVVEPSLITLAAAKAPKCLALLIAHKADIEQEDCDGKTPLVSAIVKRQEACIKMLLIAGVDTLVEYQGNIPLGLAIKANMQLIFSSWRRSYRLSDMTQLIARHTGHPLLAYFYLPPISEGRGSLRSDTLKKRDDLKEITLECQEIAKEYQDSVTQALKDFCSEVTIPGDGIPEVIVELILSSLFISAKFELMINGSSLQLKEEEAIHLAQNSIFRPCKNPHESHSKLRLVPSENQETDFCTELNLSKEVVVPYLYRK